MAQATGRIAEGIFQANPLFCLDARKEIGILNSGETAPEPRRVWCFPQARQNSPVSQEPKRALRFGRGGVGKEA